MAGLRLVEGADIWPALADALAGGDPIAPVASLDSAPLGMLRPDLPVTEPGAAAVVATSGSTGVPKGVVLSHAAMLAAAAATHERLGGEGAWVLALPPHYVAGLMVLVRAFAAGTEPQVVADLTDLPAVRLGPGRNYISLVPTQLYAALQDRALVSALTLFDAVLLGGAPAHEGQLRAARDAGVRVVTTYGMSETCGGVVYDGLTLGGVRIDLDSDGRISLTSPMSFSGYRLDPDATRAVLQDRTVLTRDRGELVEGRLRVLGRLDDVVISGGVNVDLAELQSAVDLAFGPDVVVVFGVPDERWGTQVVAASNRELGKLELRERLAGRVGPAALPKEVRRVGAFPRTESGKVDRGRLAADWTGPA